MRIRYACLVHDGASPVLLFFPPIWQALTTVIVLVLPGSAMFVLLFRFALSAILITHGRYFL